jgi:hypothetical protein
VFEAVGAQRGHELAYSDRVDRADRLVAEEGQHVIAQVRLVLHAGLRLQVRGRSEPLLSPFTQWHAGEPRVVPIAAEQVCLDRREER